MKIIPLSEGSFTVDKTKVFVPFRKGVDELQQRPVGSLLVEIQPFAVITSKDVLLFDTGLGFHSNNGVMQLHQNLIDNNIDPSSVTKILMSHLHKDHAGGIQNNKPGGLSKELSFQNAVYYVNRNEFAFASENKTSSYIQEDFELLQHSDRLQLLDDTGILDDYIFYEMTGAHSPYHTVFWIKENDEVVFFGGDVAPQLQQMKNKFIAKYDYDGRKSMELRMQWWEQAQQQHWKILFYHDIKTPTVFL